MEKLIEDANNRMTIKKLMMDIDFLSITSGISLSDTNTRLQQDQLCSDFVFLASRGIIDYSILLGVCYRQPDRAYRNGLTSADQSNVYYVGIVDMLQRYNWRWTVQRWFLGLLLCKDTHDVSAVPPDEYASRLADFVRDKLFDIDGNPSNPRFCYGRRSHFGSDRTGESGSGLSCNSSQTSTPHTSLSVCNLEPDNYRSIDMQHLSVFSASSLSTAGGIEPSSSSSSPSVARLEIARNVRKGLIRYTYVVMDLSRGMANKDWKPHRLACTSDVLQHFVKDYFDQNPISQLGVIGIKGMTAEKLSDLSGNPKTHMERIAAALAVDKEPSLQNALEIAKSSLKTVPAYGSREVVVVYGNLVTADPGDIFQTLASLKRENIRVSFIGIGAEMHLLRRIADGTDGTGDGIPATPQRRAVALHLSPGVHNGGIPVPALQVQELRPTDHLPGVQPAASVVTASRTVLPPLVPGGQVYTAPAAIRCDRREGG
ncbi:unnamed protein product [Phytophthora fragariaefolia]|uniref:Unnamed protein product n=1 Tax=Phytophthora fragariaefolia TaxID=1490495 RepID=A0A9W6U921_9STRA|nr:unnamed protein product [Phytophthora fragariaefolia]